MGRYSGKQCRLLSMFVLTGGYFLVEISVGYVTNSMALVADSFHMLSDVIALIIAFISVKMSPKKWSKSTFGWARAEVLGALVNAVFLVALCFSIFVEALKRFYKPEEIHNPVLILYVGTIGLLVNIIGLFLFHGHGHSHGGHVHDKRKLPTLEDVLSEGDINDNKGNFQLPVPCAPQAVAKAVKEPKKESSASQMNMHGVFLHILADALGSVIVIISALLVWLTEWQYINYIDPALSVIMVCLIVYSTWPLLKDSAMILLQTVPTHIQVDYLQNKLLHEIDGVLAVHEFHVWQLAGERIIASAHICCRNLVDYMAIAEKVKEFFHNEGIHSTTIQPEFISMSDSKTDNCVLDCPVSTNCTPQTCCGSMKDGKNDSKHLNIMPSKNVSVDDMNSLKGIYRSYDSSRNSIEKL
ncbi:proton-coupled zinc antiporter SLC30A1 [Parasteatoda tepidariorum]|uniref:proton-coupled zinc antiporter SLC30A1 n=1 Tax=Parasteatoda tepidariorum TaxID=114398 RepID=UPI00077F8B44|nr:zinc transporter 1 [Parasteatoda tepidariorum]XP_015923669.1 zinc transporter 1 [Parasteatoda tepidariorum]XP_042906284.1 zinc transporter 1 [Parasteatoda tepidariorum]